MALNISTLAQFIGRVSAPDNQYPFGSSKNETTPGAGDGTPYIKTRADDIFGFQQSLLTAAGLSPSGQPDTVLSPDYLDSIIGLNWYQFASYPGGARALRSGRMYVALQGSGPRYGGAQDPNDEDSQHWVVEEPLTQNQIPNNSKVTPSVTADSTPRNYSTGTTISTGWTVGTTLTQMTYINGQYNADSGTIYRDISGELGLGFYDASELVASVADRFRVPRTTGVSVSKVGDAFRVTVDFSQTTDVFSVRLEVGDKPYLHDLGETGGTGGATLGIFYENATTLTESYTVQQNAMTAGPIDLAEGVVVEVVGTWTIV